MIPKKISHFLNLKIKINYYYYYYLKIKHLEKYIKIMYIKITKNISIFLMIYF